MKLLVRRKIVKPLVFLESIKLLALQKVERVLFYKIFIIQERKRVGRKERKKVCACDIVKIKYCFLVFSGNLTVSRV